MALGDIEGGGGGVMIEPGKWLAELQDCEEMESQSGNPMLVWIWAIKEGPSEGLDIKSYTSLQDHALFGVKEHLTAFGADEDADIDLDTDQLIGRQAILVIGRAKFRDRDSGEEREASRVNAVQSSKAKKAATKAPPKRQDDDESGDNSPDELPF
jgi:hypothetical protein